MRLKEAWKTLLMPTSYLYPFLYPQAQVDLEKLKILEEFKLLRQRLDQEESFLLSRLSWLEQQGAKQLGQYVSATEKQLNSLRKLTKSLKTRLQSPSLELLKVNPL